MTLPRAKKSFGQHFLVDESVLAKIVKAAEIVPGETVLEIGPGTGVLTAALLAAGARVVAIEADRDMVSELRTRFNLRSDLRLNLVQADVLSLSDKEIGNLVAGPYKLVANLPYNVGTAVVERFLSIPSSLSSVSNLSSFSILSKPSLLVVMLQKEVADRMVAKPSKMSVLSVACQLYAKCERLFVVPPGAFRPPPKVDSAVVRLIPSVSPPFQGGARGGSDSAKTEFAKSEPPVVPLGKGDIQFDPEAVIALAKAGFASKRKQLQGNLAHAGIAEAAMVKKLLVDMGLAEKVRAQELSVEQWIELFRRLSTAYPLLPTA